MRLNRRAFFVRYFSVLGLLSSVLLVSLPSWAARGIDIPGVSRTLTAAEEARVESVIEQEIRPVDPEAAQQLLGRLRSGHLKAWLRGGFGYTSPLNGTIAIAEDFFSADGAWRAIQAKVAQKDADLLRQGIDVRKLTPEQAAPLRWSMVALLPYLDPSNDSRVRERTSRMFLASMLIHENVHCRQGRRYLIIGDLAVLAASNLSTLAGGANPMEIEAYRVQLGYAFAVKALLTRETSGKADTRPERAALEIADHMIRIVQRSLGKYGGSP